MKYPLIAIVLIAFLATGETLRCYSCISTLDPKCNDPFDKKAGVDEINFAPTCVCVKELLVTTNATYTTRGCFSPSISSKSSLSRLPITTIVSDAMYFCNTDLCNGASSITTALSTLMTLAMLSVFVNGN